MVFKRGELLPYRKWPLLRPELTVGYGDIRPEFRGLFTLPTGNDEILYHPRFFKHRQLLPELMALAPLQDDLAFKAAMLISSVPTYTVFPPKRAVSTTNAPASLFLTNRHANDDAIQRLFRFITDRGLFSWEPYLSGSACRAMDEGG